MKFTIITLFPSLFKNFINTSIIKRAIEKQIININIINIRDYTKTPKDHVDDYQYGGGPGMIMKVDCLVNAINSVKTKNCKIILMSAQGQSWKQKICLKFSKLSNDLILIAGHYEGIDERILNYVDYVISIGDYILTGGEIPIMVIIDSITRLLPNVISNLSIENESFTDGLLDYPVFTKPLIFENKVVPEVLLSGHHLNINNYRKYQALKKTYINRPDLLKKIKLNDIQKEWIKKIKTEIKK